VRRAHTAHPARADIGPARDGTQILSSDVFGRALTRERRRSDRSNKPFGLLLIEAEEGANKIPPSEWSAALDALVAAKREIDVAGWFGGRPRLGVIVPQLRASAHAGERFEVRFRRELAKRSNAQTLDRFAIRLHVYPEPRSAGGEAYWPVDSVFYPDLHRRRVGKAVDDAVKRSLDIAGSLALLVGLSPLLVLIAVAVKWSSPGSILFRQMRIGHMTQPFTMLKFRTMYSDADHRLHREFVSSFIKASSDVRRRGRNGFFKLTNDPRVTRLGRMLRSTSLDELPQLWNVLRGDMSLVGPRPPLPYELEQYEPWHRRRVLEAKPGITGLWQVAGRSRTTFDEMVRLDLRYARRRSLWNDLRILCATPAAVLSGKGAC
jgi:lipopolysaccharide/colanic/teichoic acid biosynthesis glycosyltransferase